MGSCQNSGPFLGTLNIGCGITIRTQKGTIILTTTHIKKSYWGTLKGRLFGVQVNYRDGHNYHREKILRSLPFLKGAGFRV